LTITVEDTKEGQLFESEVWRGLHKVTGVVRVPANMQLRIGSPFLGKDMNVEFHSGVGSGNMQGIQVDPQGTLLVDNGENKVNFTKYSEQHDNWGTVIVQNGGSATIKNALFEYADRALTVLGGAAVNIFNSMFRLNLTGVHVFEGSTVTINNSIFTGNTVYGVKEERNASPTLINNRLFSNFRDYYCWDLGLLSSSGINAKAGNSGNQGE
jgi:parallel beta-helix repeat protein